MRPRTRAAARRGARRAKTHDARRAHCAGPAGRSRRAASAHRAADRAVRARTRADGRARRHRASGAATARSRHTGSATARAAPVRPTHTHDRTRRVRTASRPTTSRPTRCDGRSARASDASRRSAPDARARAAPCRDRTVRPRRPSRRLPRALRVARPATLRDRFRATGSAAVRGSSARRRPALRRKSYAALHGARSVRRTRGAAHVRRAGPSAPGAR